MVGTYVITPLITALIGWGTNWVAVKMLFHPKKAFSLLGWRIQGVIPRRHEPLAESIAGIFAEKFLSSEDLIARFKELDIEEHLGGIIEEHLEDFLSSIRSESPMLGMFLGGEFAAKMKDKAKKELLKASPQIKETIAAGLAEKYDVKEMVREKLLSFSLKEMEELTLAVASKELKTIEVLGGVLGFVIGLVQVALMMWMR